MSNVNYQEKILSKINSINGKLDKLFYHMEDNQYDDRKAYVFYENLTYIDVLLGRIDSINNNGK